MMGILKWKKFLYLASDASEQMEFTIFQKDMVSGCLHSSIPRQLEHKTKRNNTKGSKEGCIH